MKTNGEAWASFWLAHQGQLRAIARKRAPKGSVDDVLNEVAAKGLGHPTIATLLDQNAHTELLKYVTRMVVHEAASAGRDSKKRTPPPSLPVVSGALDPMELREQVRLRLRSPARVIEVMPRFIRTLPGLFHFDLCPHDFLEPYLGLLTSSRVRELMEQEGSLSALLRRIADGGRRWRLARSQIDLVSALCEEVEIAMGIVGTLKDWPTKEPGGWGNDSLGFLIEQLLDRPARALVKAEHDELLKIRDGSDFTGTLPNGVNPVGRALEELGDQHAALTKVIDGQRRALTEEDRKIVHVASIEAYTAYLVWSQYQPERRGALERLLPDGGRLEELKQATERWQERQRDNKKGDGSQTSGTTGGTPSFIYRKQLGGH